MLNGLKCEVAGIAYGSRWIWQSVKNFILIRVGYTRYCFIHNSELCHHLSEWQSL